MQKSILSSSVSGGLRAIWAQRRTIHLARHHDSVSYSDICYLGALVFFDSSFHYPFGWDLLNFIGLVWLDEQEQRERNSD